MVHLEFTAVESVRQRLKFIFRVSGRPIALVAFVGKNTFTPLNFFGIIVQSQLGIFA